MPASGDGKGRCDVHRRKLERERSTCRRGGYKRGPYMNVTDARDALDRGDGERDA